VYGERDDSFPGAIGRLLREKGLTLAVAESCTGGLIGEMVTSVPGSSDYMLMDAVVYSNSSKTKVLGVNADLLRAHGAVSGEVAAAMAEGALRTSGADLAVSVTGIAGPGGGSEEKPVGTVWFALARKDRETIVKTRRLHGDRERIRTLAAYVALRMVGRAAQGVDPASE
jgi:nicotinamide-nucleotide amidase